MDEQAKPAWESRLEEAVRRLEERLEALSKTIETAVERLGPRMRQEAESDASPSRKAREPRLLGGMVLIFLGIVWMGHSLEWWSFDFPWVPVVLIFLGIYLVLQSRHVKRDPDSE